MGRVLAWTAVLFSLLAFLTAIVAVLVVRNNWGNFNRRESSLLWIYLTIILTFVAALITAINAELTIDACVLPYSGRLAVVSP